MTTLPPIAPPRGPASLHRTAELQLPEVKSQLSGDISSRRSTSRQSTAHSSGVGRLVLRRRGGDGGGAGEKRKDCRAEQPRLTYQETAQYRNSLKQNLCIGMIQAGYHKSFREVFTLIEMQKQSRLSAGPESVMWTMTMLSDEHEKLEMLVSLLTQAEASNRLGDQLTVYKCQHQLATYFLSTGDRWLADYFFEQCLDTSAKVTTDGGRIAAEAHCNMGLALQEAGLYFAAVEKFEEFYKLTVGQTEWYAADGRLLHTEACHMLSLVYATIAGQASHGADMPTALRYHQLAYDAAQQSKDLSMKSQASYKLGTAFEANNDSDKAIEYLMICQKICEVSGDDVTRGETFEALAKSYQSKGMVDESIKNLQKFVELAERSKDERATARACSALGAMFNRLGQYDEAVEYFNKSYNLCRALGETETVGESRVHFGIATAHRMLAPFSAHVLHVPASHNCTLRLIDWKDSRAEELNSEPAETADAVIGSNGSQRVHAPYHDEPNDDSADEDQQEAPPTGKPEQPQSPAPTEDQQEAPPTGEPEQPQSPAPTE